MGPEHRGSLGKLPVVLALVWFCITVLCAALSFINASADIALYGAAACLVATLPTLRQGYSWLSPWSLVILALYIGSGARGLAILTRGANDPVVQDLYLLGRDVREYGWPGALYVLGTVLLTAGYMAAERRGPRAANSPASWIHRYAFGQQFWLVAILCALVGLLAFWQYVNNLGGLDLTNVSAKRTSFYVEGERYQGGQGQWRAVNELSSIAFWLVVARFAADAKRLTPAWILALSAFFANAVLLPFYSSVRSQMIFITLTALAIYVGLRLRVPARLAAVVGAGALAMLAVTTALRQRSEGTGAALDLGGAVNALSDAMLMNLNFAEVPKAANIMLAVPDQLPYSMGQTVVTYGVAWIPRSIWPDKPIIDSGVAVGVQVYGTDGSSIPPGALAECYWSFGLVGLVVGMFALGVLLGFLASWVGATEGPAGAVLYSAAVFDLGGNAVSGSIGYALSSALLSSVMVLIALRAAGGATARDDNGRRLQRPAPARRVSRRPVGSAI